ncbi:hypothetical protein TNCV_148271, partial [Trichonephila clavipes]
VAILTDKFRGCVHGNACSRTSVVPFALCSSFFSLKSLKVLVLLSLVQKFLLQFDLKAPAREKTAWLDDEQRLGLLWMPPATGQPDCTLSTQRYAYSFFPLTWIPEENLKHTKRRNRQGLYDKYTRDLTYHNFSELDSFSIVVKAPLRHPEGSTENIVFCYLGFYQIHQA